MKLLLLAGILSCSAWAQVDTRTFPNEGRAAASGLTFNSSLEGIYKIQVKCAEPQTNECKRDRFETTDRLTIVDTRRNLGLWVSFSDTRITQVIETFKYTDIGPTDHQISGYPKLGSGFGNDIHFAYFELDVDPLTAGIKGYFIYLEDGSIFEFSGQKISVVGDIVRSVLATPIATEKIVGTYRGTIGDQPGKLVVVRLPDGKLVASYTSDAGYLGGSYLQFAYTMNDWDPASGFFRLVFFNPRFITLGEMAVNLSEVNGKIEIDGFQFTGFANYPVHFSKSLSPMMPTPAPAAPAAPELAVSAVRRHR